MAAQVTYLEEHAEVGLLGTWAKIVSEEGEEGTFEPPVADPALRRYLLWDSPFIHSSVMFRRAAFLEAGGYPEGLAEEYRLWIRMARSWKIAMLPEGLVTHRIHRASYTRRQRRAAAIGGRFKAQWEAARTLGLTERQVLTLVRAPQAFRLALAPMTNDFVALLKDSSLVSVLTVLELTKQTQIFATNLGSWVIPGTLCAALYLAMSLPLSTLARRLELRWRTVPQ